MSRNQVLVCAAVLAFTSILVSSCDEDDPSEQYAPRDCNEDRPESGLLTVNVTINPENQSVPLTVYRGNFEEDIVVFVDTLSVPEAVYDMPVAVRYSVTATYKVGGQTIIALDDGTIDRNYTNYMDARCWEVNDLRLNLELAEMR